MMDFSKTKLHQRTRSCYNKLYLEYSEKHGTKKKRLKPDAEDGVNGSASGEVLSVSEDVGPSKTKKPRNVKKKVRNVRKVEAESDGNETKVKKGKSLKRGKNVSTSSLVDELDESDLEVSKSSERTRGEMCAKRGKIVKRRKGVKRKDAKEDSDDDVLLSEYEDGSGNAEKETGTVVVKKASGAKGKCLKRKRRVGGKFVTGVRMSSRGCAVDDSDDDEGVIFLGDDIRFLDDYDPSHSSRVESNEVKASPVDLDSIQADAVDDDGIFVKIKV